MWPKAASMTKIPKPCCIVYVMRGVSPQSVSNAETLIMFVPIPMLSRTEVEYAVAPPGNVNTGLARLTLTV
jgi:hypothetical protein